MTRSLMSFDTGLATFGSTVLTVDLEIDPTEPDHLLCVDVDVFASAPGRDMSLGDDRARRARELAAWMWRKVEHWKPCAIAAEAMSFPRGANPIVCISLAWGVLAAIVEIKRIPLVAARPLMWRKHLVRNGRETAAHAEAVRRVPTAIDGVRRIEPDYQAHALDALGVGCWAISTSVVRAAMGMAAF